MKLTKLFVDFFNSERAGGLILIFCTLFSLVVTNILPSYGLIWHVEIANHHLVHWINDGLMAIFFLLIGLELEREIYIGELSSLKNASLPLLAALGGMVIPALVYYMINVNGGNVRGLGVPMATDIAFALGILSLLGNRVPNALKVFLTALAVIDDLGAIIVIAIFYTTTISLLNLGIALGIFAVLIVFNRLKVHQLWPYLAGGIAMWYFMLNSGVHATITGVLLAFAIPFGNGDERSPSYKLQHHLHKPVAFFILPLFALANTSIIIESDFYYALGSAISLGIMAGLLIGKPTGIVLFSFIATRLKLSVLPDHLGWKHLIGAGFLGGIGFTMSIFISLLAFDDIDLIDQSKISVMIASVVAGLIGFAWLKSISKTNVITE
ncbi:Na+/H+ antiporter NhaA [Chryseosolibacter indicus]|uniref:Na(+)/H(+) antiporter NhaA n=1 Tax=Chryseosolibacter indicus TaxID=2782351 RepID=A0ABS5VZG0_9BACT|nr:Na+/H+ antiporter NhaA [Chryseosolibacter indicus]MBT1706237.1 Na+/H+ antiporter NhaA [Chryseosolibacter indicus]